MPLTARVGPKGRKTARADLSPVFGGHDAQVEASSPRLDARRVKTGFPLRLNGAPLKTFPEVALRCEVSRDIRACLGISNAGGASLNLEG